MLRGFTPKDCNFGTQLTIEATGNLNLSAKKIVIVH